MEKFAVDLDKVLDDFELNEDDSCISNKKNISVGSYEDLISSKYSYYGSHPHSISVKNNSSYSCDSINNVNVVVPAIVNQKFDNINLDDADFAPSSKTAASIEKSSKPSLDVVHATEFNDKNNDQVKVPSVELQESKNPVVVNGFHDDVRTSPSSYDQCSEYEGKNKMSSFGDVIHENNVNNLDSQCKESEPDVVQVSIPLGEVLSNPMNNVSNFGAQDDNDYSLVPQTLPDVMVVSNSSKLVHLVSPAKDEINYSPEYESTMTASCEKEVEESTNFERENLDEPSEEMESSFEPQLNESNEKILDDHCPSNLLIEENVNKINEKSIDSEISEVVAFKDPVVDESDLDSYMKELEQLENESSKIESMPDETKTPNNESFEIIKDKTMKSHDREEMSVCNKISDNEGSVKRQIDQIDSNANNLGARPKKSLLNCEVMKPDAMYESSKKSLNPSIVDGSATKIFSANLNHDSGVKHSEENFSESLVNKQLSSVSTKSEACDSEFGESMGNIPYRENSNVVRRQRPTSLNLPSRINLNLPEAANIKKSSVDNLESYVNKSDTQSQLPALNDEPMLSSANKHVQSSLQRPSSLLVGTPLNSLMNNVIHPPGHTPGDTLGLPDFGKQLESPPNVPDDSVNESPSASPTVISQIENDSSECSDVTDFGKIASNNIANHDSSPVTSTSTEDQQLGRVPPFWVPDDFSSNCMLCNAKFTVIKRRHHCRACGKVLCSQCCNLKAKIQYMDYKDARVCKPCFDILSKVDSQRALNNIDSTNQSMDILGNHLDNSPVSPDSTLFRGRSPNPNNPDEYCSTIPPLQQAQAALQKPPPTVMVPVGVLKREGSKIKGEPKQVIFSDGIRPGGDLTELDGTYEPHIPTRKSFRTQKKVVLSPDDSTKSNVKVNSKPPESPEESSDDSSQENTGLISNQYLEDESNSDLSHLMDSLKDESSDPITFSVNKNLFVLIKIVTLDCCVKKTCWCFTTKGMCTIGQDEIVVVLECLPDETALPSDVLKHLSYIYEEASKGNVVSDMSHSLVTQSFLKSKDHGGFLYIRPTFQCLNKLILPEAPYLFGILLDKWEAPWAKVFPMRLMLRLGAEFRYYPCPLISVRFRKPVFCEIGHTIMNVLADFRNYQYSLPSVKGMVTVMEDKKTYINFPRNRYDDVMKAVNNSNDHVLAFSSNFSMEADSHLVCVQNDDGHYQTQAINIQNKARKVTGASFVVFNGALKSSYGLSAKSSIVEDGLMVQIYPETMLALRQSLKDMQDFRIGCGPLNTSNPDEVVHVKWIDEDKNVNIGVRSPVDGMQLDGIQSIRIHSGTDYMGDDKLIRWTEVFLIKTDDEGNSTKMDSLNISRLSETLAQACCIALTPHLNQLRESSINKIGLRVTINSEKVEYEVGTNEERLPDFYMNDLDTELVPVIHRAASNHHDELVILELLFYILDY